MTSMRHAALSALFVWLACVLQGRVAHSISLGIAEPNFPLVALTCSALLLGSRAGIGLGFLAGLLTASSFPATFGSLFASRIVAGAFAGGLQRSLIRDNVLVPPLVTLAATLIAEVISFVMAPGLSIHHLRHWALSLGGEALYNAALALPLHFLMRLLQIGRLPVDPYARLT